MELIVCWTWHEGQADSIKETPVIHSKHHEDIELAEDLEGYLAMKRKEKKTWIQKINLLFGKLQLMFGLITIPPEFSERIAMLERLGRTMEIPKLELARGTRNKRMMRKRRWRSQRPPRQSVVLWPQCPTGVVFGALRHTLNTFAHMILPHITTTIRNVTIATVNGMIACPSRMPSNTTPPVQWRRSKNTRTRMGSALPINVLSRDSGPPGGHDRMGSEDGY
ncbi:hypothetical protein PHISCL_05829 [Aspergillus sclerotialis]|uniref:Uncharacterized protein n=1 Tax=Aspergillus sclerotialis TaxID=2070753 RepID=A0A3A2ZV21_9EURO|nr:hypothetical protein PHISCL_05829 [Aspergillus sclerotialis]